MTNFRLRARAGLTGVLALVCASAAACDSVLDIEDPKMRPDGEAGEPSIGGKSFGGTSTTPQAGEAGQGGNAGSAGSGGTSAGEAGMSSEAGSGGEGGTVTPQGCVLDSKRCTDGQPEVCDNTGEWVASGAKCEFDCVGEGKCTACHESDTRCAVCPDGETCNTNQPQVCEGGVWKNKGSECKQFCQVGKCETTPSCTEFAAERTTCRNTESCCASYLLPGGDFNLLNPDGFIPAKVTPFLLDKYEVTVGRMRQFVFAYDPKVFVAGRGKSAHINGDTGWDPLFALPADKEALVAQLKGCTGTTWTDNEAINNRLPMNCVSFTVAYAFCIWDGGRLPTDAEWSFAAAGGSQERQYPWSLPGAEPDISTEIAHYDGYGIPTTGPIDVGGKPLGDSRWRHVDLGGNVQEWTLDYSGGSFSECHDCLNTIQGERLIHGGAYDSIGESLLSYVPTAAPDDNVRASNGFRCARDLK
jgi:formylglycine-generating enzyme